MRVLLASAACCLADAGSPDFAPLSSTQVRQSANTSLKRFGDVIHNPEIKALVPTLLKALVDPTGKTNAALTHLLNTAFSHFIDAPSLALVRPYLPLAPLASLDRDRRRR